MIREYLTSGQIKTFDVNTLPSLLLLMEPNEEKSYPGQLKLAKAMLKGIEEEFFDAFLDENSVRLDLIAECFVESKVESFIPKAAEECRSFTTKGAWINKKMELTMNSSLFENDEKEKLIKKVLNEYKTLWSHEKNFQDAFPAFKTSGLTKTPWVYQALNLYDPTCQVRFDIIDEEETIKEGKTILSIHLNAFQQHVPFLKNLVNFAKNTPSNKDILSVTLPAEWLEGLEKVVAYLKTLDPAQLRSAKPAEAIAIFQLCLYWGIEGKEAEIFSHFSEKDFTDKSIFTFICSTGNDFLLNKSIRGLFQQAAQSENAYAEVQKLFIKGKPPVEKLDLSGMGLSDALIKLLKPCKKQLKELNLQGNGKLTDKTLSHLATLESLTSLNLSRCALITDEGLRSLESLSLLASLNLNKCGKLTDTGLKSLEKLTNLTSLNLYKCQELTNTGLISLEKLTNLTSLNLYYCYRLTNTGLMSLEKLTNLTSLGLSRCDKLINTGLKSLEKLTNLTSLNLSRCDKLTDIDLKSLEKLTNLTSLDLSRG